MSFYITLTILSFAVIVFMIVVNLVDKKRGRSLYTEKLKKSVDPKIKAFWVAILENVARILKSIFKKVSKSSRFLVKKSKILWETTKEKVDRVFNN